MTSFSIPKMTCGHCKKSVEEAINRLDADIKIEIDLESHIAAVSGTVEIEAVIAALKDAGYEATAI
jgi:copper chaperone